MSNGNGTYPYDLLGDYARLDTHRQATQGMPEFIYAESKTPEQVAAIMEAVYARHGYVLASRAAPTHANAVKARFQEVHYDPTSRLLMVGKMLPQAQGQVLILAAGTSDLPVAEEACGVLDFLGDRVKRLYDVGVAGVHRLLAHVDVLSQADVLIVVAGMEAALPTLVAGLVSAPVIGVPTSVGYGANFQGLAALLGMLTSCVPGLTVVNIDNGLGAAAAAHRMLKLLRASIPPESNGKAPLP